MEPSLSFYDESTQVMSATTPSIGNAVQVAPFDCNTSGDGCQMIVMSAYAVQSKTCYYVVINKDLNVGTFSLFGLAVPGDGTYYYAAQSSADGAGNMKNCSLDGVAKAPTTGIIAGDTAPGATSGTGYRALPTKAGWTSAGRAAPVSGGTASGVKTWRSGQFPS